MSDDQSILHRMEEQGHPARRVELKGTERATEASQRYEIVGELARGGIGAVHRGRDNDLGRDVALKVLLDRHLKSPELVQRFVEEAQIGGQLQHPGIVPVYELGLQADQRPYFAMKLVKGETLAARLASGSDSRRDLLAVFREVCRTMAYAHARGVIHRDLKPANVMIGNFGEVQVVDWGFAKVLRKGGVADEGLSEKAERDVTMVSTVRSHTGSEPSIAGSVMGTPSYMPPEQALGRVEDLDERSDVFSLGAILCEILLGRPPYKGDDRLNDAAQARLEPVHAQLDACDADERLVALCKRCLQPLPQDRPASAETLADEVAAYLTTAEGRAHRAQIRALKAEARAAEQRRARRLTTLVGGSVVAALVLAVGAYLWIDAGHARRERDRQAKVELALQDASRLRKARKWPEALAAAQRARELGDNGALARTIRAEKRRADERAEQEAEDAAFLAALEDARAARGDEVDDVKTDKAYVAAVEKYGVDTERLRASPHVLAFAAVFDVWARMRRVTKALKGADWRRIEAHARAIDPEHNALRDAMRADKPTELARFAASDDALVLPPALLSTIGAALRDAGLHADAVTFLRRAIRKHPGDYWLHYTLGAVGDRTEDWSMAALHYSVAIAIRPRSIEARHMLGQAREMLGDPDGAIAAWQDALAMKPDWGHGYSHIGSVLRKQGEIDDAEAAFRKAIDGAPDDPHARAYYGMFLVDEKSPEDGIAQLRIALRLEPTAPRHIALAQALAAHDLEGAHAEVNKALKLDVEHAGAWDTLGFVLWAKRKPAEALRAYRNAVKFDPKRANAYIGIGTVLSNHYHRHDKAIEEFRNAIDVEPTNALAHANIGIAWREKGDFNEARRWLRKAIALKADSFIHFNLGALLCDRLGEYELAIVEFKRAIALDENNASAWGGLGAAYGNMGDIKKAVFHLHESIKITPTAAAYASIGGLFRLQGRSDSAIVELRRALALDPRHLLAHRNLHLAYAKLRRELANFVRDPARDVAKLASWTRDPGPGLTAEQKKFWAAVDTLIARAEK